MRTPPRTIVHAAICRISTRAGWGRANCCGMGATLTARRLRAKFSKDTTAGRSIRRAPTTPRISKRSPIQPTLCSSLPPPSICHLTQCRKASDGCCWGWRWRPFYCGSMFCAGGRPRRIVLTFIVLMLGWLPMVQGMKLQQLSLLVAGLLAGCAAFLAGGWLFLAGGLLALATIKPQLTWPLVLWLLFWAGSDWRSRRRFVFGFGIAMLLLLGGAQLILPGWLPMFVAGLGKYHQYTQAQSVLTSLFGLVMGRILGAACILGCAICVWRLRRKPASTADFGNAVALVLALTIVIVPMSALYNQVLLAPAILALLRSEASDEPILPSIRRARAVGYFVIVWPWIATIGLSLFYPWLTPDLRQQLWPTPLYSSYMTPVFVFGLALLNTWRSEADCLPESAPAE